MKLFGFLLLITGWLLVLTALLLLRDVRSLTLFVLAGMMVEGLGLGLVIRAHLVLRGERA